MAAESKRITLAMWLEKLKEIEGATDLALAKKTQAQCSLLIEYHQSLENLSSEEEITVNKLVEIIRSYAKSGGRTLFAKGLPNHPVAEIHKEALEKIECLLRDIPYTSQKVLSEVMYTSQEVLNALEALENTEMNFINYTVAGLQDSKYFAQNRSGNNYCTLSAEIRKKIQPTLKEAVAWRNECAEALCNSLSLVLKAWSNDLCYLSRDLVKGYAICFKESFPEEILKKLKLLFKWDGGTIIRKYHFAENLIESYCLISFIVSANVYRASSNEKELICKSFALELNQAERKRLSDLYPGYSEPLTITLTPAAEFCNKLSRLLKQNGLGEPEPSIYETVVSFSEKTQYAINLHSMQQATDVYDLLSKNGYSVRTNCFATFYQVLVDDAPPVPRLSAPLTLGPSGSATPSSGNTYSFLPPARDEFKIGPSGHGLPAITSHPSTTSYSLLSQEINKFEMELSNYFRDVIKLQCRSLRILLLELGENTIMKIIEPQPADKINKAIAQHLQSIGLQVTVLGRTYRMEPKIEIKGSLHSFKQIIQPEIEKQKSQAANTISSPMATP